MPVIPASRATTQLSASFLAAQRSKERSRETMTIQFVYSQAVSTALNKYAVDLASPVTRHEFEFAENDIRVPKLPEIYEDMVFLKELNSGRDCSIERQSNNGQQQHKNKTCLLPCIEDQPVRESQCATSPDQSVLPDVFATKTKQVPSYKITVRGK